MDEIREEHAEGDEPPDAEQRFLEAADVPLEQDEEHDPSEEGRGTAPS